MNADQQRAIKDAHQVLANVPHSSGAIVILFTKDFAEVQLASTVPADRAPAVLRALLNQLEPPALIVPGRI